MNKETFAFEYSVKANTSKWKHYFAKFSSQDLAQLFENLLYAVGLFYDLGGDRKNSRFLTLMQEQHTHITLEHTKRHYLGYSLGITNQMYLHGLLDDCMYMIA